MEKSNVGLLSLIHPDEEYIPERCLQCATRTRCFPTLFDAQGNLTAEGKQFTDALEQQEREYHAEIVKFRQAHEAQTYIHSMRLFDRMEAALPEVDVHSEGIHGDGKWPSQIVVSLNFKDPEKFFEEVIPEDEERVLMERFQNATERVKEVEELMSSELLQRVLAAPGNGPAN